MRLWAKAIEAKRKEMSFYAKRKGILSEKTIRCSQELDKLLLPYEKRVQGRLLSIEKKIDGTRFDIILFGELDYFSIEIFYETLETLKQKNISIVMIDLSKLVYIDSIGYEALFQTVLDLYPKGICIEIIGLNDQQKQQLCHGNIFNIECYSK